MGIYNTRNEQDAKQNKFSMSQEILRGATERI